MNKKFQFIPIVFILFLASACWSETSNVKTNENPKIEDTFKNKKTTTKNSSNFNSSNDSLSFYDFAINFEAKYALITIPSEFTLVSLKKLMLQKDKKIPMYLTLIVLKQHTYCLKNFNIGCGLSINGNRDLDSYPIPYYYVQIFKLYSEEYLLTTSCVEIIKKNQSFLLDSNFKKEYNNYKKAYKEWKKIYDTD